MQNNQIDDLKQFIDSRLSQSEAKTAELIDARISQSEVKTANLIDERISQLENKMAAGFAGVAETIEVITNHLDERLVKLES